MWSEEGRDALKATNPTVIVEDVKHPRHLAEYQHARAVGLEFREQLVEHHELVSLITATLEGHSKTDAGAFTKSGGGGSSSSDL